MANLFESEHVMEKPGHSSPGELVHGDSEMAELIRRHPWDQSSLGPILHWPVTLLSTVNLVLASQFPMSIYWGPQFLLLYNDAYRSFLAAKHPGALGRPGPEVWSLSWPQFSQAFDDIFQRGTTVHGENVMIPLEVDGKLVDRYWTYSRSPIFDDGEIVGVFTVVQETTSTIVSRRELARSEESLRMALAAARGVGTYDWDIPGNLVYADANFARVYNVDPAAAAAGTPIENFTASIHPDDVECVGVAIEREIRTAEGFAEEYRLVQPDGSVRWVAVRGRATCSPQGEPLRFAGVAIDITERKLTESALIQSEKLAAVGRLASSIAHEINNPLEAVTNLLYLARTSAELETARDFLDLAERELARASAITNQTLRFHKQSTKPQQVTAKELFESAIALYHGKLLNAQIALDTDFRSTRAVRCFEGEIRQVLANLIANAVDAIKQDGTGRLQLRSLDGETHGQPGVLLTVADNGAGIPDAARTRLFEPFFTTKGLSGNGLGLWISHEIVRRHHGSVRMHTSQQPHCHGTVFTVFLPVEGVREE